MLLWVFFIAFFALILFTKIKIKLAFCMINDVNSYYICVSWMGLPIYAKTEDHSKIFIFSKTNKIAEKNSLLRMFSILVKREVRKHIKWRLNIDKIYLKIKFGSSDAAVTAVIIGILDAIVYPIICVLYKGKKVKSSKIDIKPSFGEEIILVDFNCIIFTRIVHIIIELCKIYSVRNF